MYNQDPSQKTSRDLPGSSSAGSSEILPLEIDQYSIALVLDLIREAGFERDERAYVLQ